MKHFFKIFFIALIFLFMGISFYKGGERVDFVILSSHPWYLCLSILFGFLNFLFSYLLWFFIMRYCWKDRGDSLTVTTAYQQYTLANLSRYLPAGKAVQFFSFAHFAKDPLHKWKSVFSFFVLTYTGLLSGAFLGVCGYNEFIPAQYKNYYYLALSGFLLCSWIFCDQRILLFVVQKMGKKIPSSLILEEFLFSRIMMSSLAIAGAIFCWMPEVCSAFYLLKMFNPQYGFDIFIYLLSSYVVASYAGYFSLLGMAGMGVREGVFMFFLVQKISFTEALFVSVGVRFTSFISEFIFTAPLLVLGLKSFFVNFHHQTLAPKERE